VQKRLASELTDEKERHMQSDLRGNGQSPQLYPVCRGVRGATTCDANTREAILEATRELLGQIIQLNDMRAEDVASIFFTTTVDLDAEYPALAARQLGWLEAALMCGQEMRVPGSLNMVIRVLVHWNTTKRLDEIQHVYIRGAVSLRPDRSISQLGNEPVRASRQEE
jgi:chorismate mutase